MTAQPMALTGTAGWVEGESFFINSGDDIIIGRSRSCDISLRRIPSYLARSTDERDNDHAFNTVSRRHLRLMLDDEQLTIEDLSTNGSYCNEELITGSLNLQREDIGEDGVLLRLGTRETFCLAPSTAVSDALADEFEGDDTSTVDSARLPKSDDSED